MPTSPLPPAHDHVLRGRDVLITGGSGSFGRAFARRALDADARRVVIFSRDEFKQHEMRAAFDGDPRLRFLIGSVTHADRVERAMWGIDYVVHAAAMKQIPACELNPAECVETNVTGTRIVAAAAIAAGAERAVFLSTDKAAAPNTHYGACKLAAERLWTQANVYAAGKPTRLVATRYGNVLGSRGSVVPLWREQAKTGRITLTDARCTRFWMTLEQAVDLVMLALADSRGGEVFVPKIGSCTIGTLAALVAPGTARVEVGLRRGEKLHETLISEDEIRDVVDRGTHYRIEPDRSWEDVAPERDRGTWLFEPYRSDTARGLLLGELRAMLGMLELVDGCGVERFAC